MSENVKNKDNKTCICKNISSYAMMNKMEEHAIQKENVEKLEKYTRGVKFFVTGQLC